MPRAGLSQAAVVDVALAVVDEKGLDALSIAAVADRAGVAAPSLYKHVGSLADLRELMAEQVIKQVTATFAREVMGRSRDEAVAALLRAYRAYVVENPGRYQLIPLNPLGLSPAVARAGNESLDVFRAVVAGYGLEASAATHAIRRLRAAAHGFASLEAGGGFGLDEDVNASFDQLIEMCLRSLR